MCAEAHQLAHTHTSIHRPHLCTDPHSGRRVFAHAQCHTFTHIHARSVCVCAEACATTVANDCAHARSLTHARTQTHSSGLQRVGCSALSVREGCLWQAHTHTHTLTDTKTDIQTRTHIHRAPESTVRQSARSERVAREQSRLREHQHWEVRGNLSHRGQEGTWNQRSYSGAR